MCSRGQARTLAHLATQATSPMMYMTNVSVAAGWDLLIRFARRFGVRRGRGQSICTHRDNSVKESAAADYATAAATFDSSFGAAGRLRTGALHAICPVHA